MSTSDITPSLPAIQGQAAELAKLWASIDWQTPSPSRSALSAHVLWILDFVANLTPASEEPTESFQARVVPWVLECFGSDCSDDLETRNHRFLEEAIELVQACGGTASAAHQLVDYVFSRPVGVKHQEVGGVQLTLAALCNAQGLNMDAAAEDELARVWTMVEKIRAKHDAKPKHSPLPEHFTPKHPYRTVLDDQAMVLLNSVKAWHDSEENVPFPLDVRMRMDAVLLAVEVRRGALPQVPPEHAHVLPIPFEASCDILQEWVTDLRGHLVANCLGEPPRLAIAGAATFIEAAIATSRGKQ